MEIDQDNLRTGTARLSRVSWALLILLVLRSHCVNFLCVYCLLSSVNNTITIYVAVHYLSGAISPLPCNIDAWSPWTTHRKSSTTSRMVTWPMRSCYPKRSRWWPHYLWGTISPLRCKVGAWSQWTIYSKAKCITYDILFHILIVIFMTLIKNNVIMRQTKCRPIWCFRVVIFCTVFIGH